LLQDAASVTFASVRPVTKTAPSWRGATSESPPPAIVVEVWSAQVAPSSSEYQTRSPPAPPSAVGSLPAET